MKVFVTGGNGFIGSVVVRTLAARGHTVRVLLRERSRTDRLAGLAFERALGDVRDAVSVREGLRGCDGVIHLASLSNWNDIHSPLMPEVVVGGTRNVLEAASGLGKPRVVFVSSSTAINGSREPTVHNEASPMTLPLDRFAYVKAKIEGERMCREHALTGLPVTIVNPTEVYGPNDIDRITAGTLIDFATSTPVMVSAGGTSIVHVEDVAAGILAALERGRPGERYILGSDNLTIRELAALTLEFLGRKNSIVGMPNGMLEMLGWMGRTLRVPLPFNPAIVPYAVLYWFMDNSKAKRELGVEFRPARAVLEPTLAWIRDTCLGRHRNGA
jgi:dihydroflavonol-4-reductase